MRSFILLCLLLISIGISAKIYLDSKSDYELEIMKWKDAYNQEHYKVLNYSPKDTIYKNIIKVIKDKPQEIVHFKTTTRVDTVVKRVSDTVLLDYGKWGYISLIDSTKENLEKLTKLNIKLNNDYSVVIGKKGFFKPKHFAEVISENPFTGIDKVLTYKVSGIKTPKFFFSVNIGYGFNQRLKLTPYVGLGVSYNLFTIY